MSIGAIMAHPRRRKSTRNRLEMGVSLPTYSDKAPRGDPGGTPEGPRKEVQIARGSHFFHHEKIRVPQITEGLGTYA